MERKVRETKGERANSKRENDVRVRTIKRVIIAHLMMLQLIKE